MCFIDKEFNYNPPILFKNDGNENKLWSNAKCLSALNPWTGYNSFK